MVLFSNSTSHTLLRRYGTFRYWFRILTLILLTALTVGATEVRVASFNLYNYLVTDRMVDGVYRKNYPKPESEKTLLRDMIRRVNPDVLALQEMGDEPFLRELQNDLSAEGIHYPHAILMSGDDTVRHTAVLAKIPFFETHQYHNLHFKHFGKKRFVKRGLLETVFKTEGQTWSLFTVHLKSRRTSWDRDPQSFYYRLGEATACSNQIQKRYASNPKALYLIAGDFNATQGNPVLQKFDALATLVPAYDSNGETWTYHYARENVYESVDFLLASPTLFEKVKGKKGMIESRPKIKVISDHRMVYLDLIFQ